MIVDKINAYLSGTGQTIEEAILDDVARLARVAFERQFGPKEARSGALRLSSIGHCLRQQAYSLLGFEPNGKEIDSRARMVFFQGDMTELAIIQLAKVAGCQISLSGLGQDAIFLDGIEGHADGILTENHKRYLVEAKSMSSFGFKEFERGVIEEGYRYQINAYMAAHGLEEAIVVALNKDAGVLAEKSFSLDLAIVKDIISRIARLKTLSKTSPLPDRPYAPDEKGFLPWRCLYCAFHKTCWPKAEKVLVSNKYKLKLIKELIKP